MKIKQFEIWVADLNPQIGTESGKVRPVLVVQTNLLNAYHPSTIVCPLSTNVKAEVELLRVHLKRGDGNVTEDCDIMIDQLRAIDNKRLIKRVGDVPQKFKSMIKKNLNIILDLD
ncbi:type II toxin-antitoxin system PemK/MazF family toxin [soil metagenome]